ncbi:965_t:CDS:2 [Acaulospora colombiana]|uniref:965_t:CDS:1 n=1 Tax=Acaulospora colombiana TaxID=27376 RepID=A0ACA9K1T9_9GLOM|nr:965_t:CDS:2 [Acaulospora colombiana]
MQCEFVKSLLRQNLFVFQSYHRAHSSLLKNFVKRKSQIDGLELLHVYRQQQASELFDDLNHIYRKNHLPKKKLPNIGDRNTTNLTESAEIIDGSENEAESIDIDQDEEEIGRFTQDEVDIRSKLLKILTARQKEDKRD